MPLTVVSAEIRRIVEDEWRQIPDEQSVIAYALRLAQKLRQTNPAIARHFENLLSNLANEDWSLHVLRVVYACRVYRMLELAGPVVVVSHETAAPIITEFLRDHNTYGQAIIDKLEVENPEILNTGRPLIEGFQERGDTRSASLVLTFGLLLYKTIESQKEANELAVSLDSFGSDS